MLGDAGLDTYWPTDGYSDTSFQQVVSAASVGTVNQVLSISHVANVVFLVKEPFGPAGSHLGAICAAWL